MTSTLQNESDKCVGKEMKEQPELQSLIVFAITTSSSLNTGVPIQNMA